MDNSYLIPVIIAIIAALPGLLALALQYSRQRDEHKIKKRHAEIEQVEAAANLSEAAMNLIAPYRNRIKELESQVLIMRSEIDDLKKKIVDYENVVEGAGRLYYQVKATGHDPIYIPPLIDPGD